MTRRINHTIVPELGILVANAGSTTDDKAAIVTNVLKSRFTRFTAISMAGWAGSSPAYETYTSYGLFPHLVIDVGLTGSNPTGWITPSTSPTLSTLVTRVEDLITTYRPREIILDNEEMNSEYHTQYTGSNLDLYINIATAVQPICNKYNVLLSNGGIGDFYPIHAFIFRYVKSAYGQTAADTFGDTVFLSTGQYNAANTPDSNPTLEQHITDLENIYYSDVFDIWNFHMYEPTGDQTGASATTSANELFWKYAMEAFKNSHPTKRRFVGCNEWGPRQSEHPELIADIIRCHWKYGYYLSDCWSGNGAALSTVPLTYDTGFIKPNGQPFADWQDDHYESISLA